MTTDSVDFLDDNYPRDLYECAVTTWGKEAQMDMAVEEAGELITAIARWWRGREDDEEMIEEIADLRIMLGQMSYIFGEEQVENEMAKKLTRLESRLADAD